MTRVLTFDAGLHLGFGAIGGGKPPVAGSRLLRGGPRNMGVTMRHADQVIRDVILQEKPDVIGFATPFVGQVRIPIFKGGKPTGLFKTQPIDPNSIRPLYGVLAKVEEIADELHIRCVEVSEGECRNAFLNKVPRKSKDIKAAIMAGVRQRGWPCPDDHGADSLCVASHILDISQPTTSHETTPLFSTAPAPTKKSRRKKPCKAAEKV